MEIIMNKLEILATATVVPAFLVSLGLFLWTTYLGQPVPHVEVLLTMHHSLTGELLEIVRVDEGLDYCLDFIRENTSSWLVLNCRSF
jgi:hypothetical protein